MDTNWLHEALLSEAKEYLAAPTPSHAEVVRRAEGPSMPVYSDEPLPDEPDEAFMDDEEPAYEPEIHEYETPQDADMVSRQLEMQMHENKLRTLVTGGCTLILLLAGFLSEYTHIGSLKLHLSSGPIPYLISNLVFLLLATAFNLKSILHGFRGLFRLRANPDSGIAVATTAAVIQSIAAFFFQESVMSGTLHLYSSLAAVALLLNGLGKSVMLRRIDRNFQFVSSPEQKYAVETLSGNAEAAKIAAGCCLSAPHGVPRGIYPVVPSSGSGKFCLTDDYAGRIFSFSDFVCGKPSDVWKLPGSHHCLYGFGLHLRSGCKPALREPAAEPAEQHCLQMGRHDQRICSD